jgi:hypothetical protein
MLGDFLVVSVGLGQVGLALLVTLKLLVRDVEFVACLLGGDGAAPDAGVEPAEPDGVGPTPPVPLRFGLDSFRSALIEVGNELVKVPTDLGYPGAGELDVVFGLEVVLGGGSACVEFDLAVPAGLAVDVVDRLGEQRVEQGQVFAGVETVPEGLGGGLFQAAAGQGPINHLDRVGDVGSAGVVVFGLASDQGVVGVPAASHAHVELLGAGGPVHDHDRLIHSDPLGHCCIEAADAS